MTTNIKTVLAVALAAGLVAACSSQPVARLSSADLYAQRMQAQLEDNDLRSAESTLMEMELYYPRFSTTQAMELKMISAYYKAAEMDRVVDEAKRYVATYPDANDIDQAYYYSGLATYDRGLKYLTGDVAEKSPLYAKAARESFMSLLRCCLESHYINEAGEKVAYLDEKLAQYEFNQMRAELLQGNKQSAVAKGNSIIETYPATNAAGVTEVVLSALDRPEVLDRLLIATALTINQEAAAAIVAKADAAAPAAATVAAADANSDETTVPEALGAAAVDQVAQGTVAAKEPVAATTVAETAPAEADTKEPQGLVAAVLAATTARYTVQMASGRTLALVKGYMKRMGLADVVNYEPRTVNGEQWYSAYYGAYADSAAAQRDAKRLMEKVGAKDLWVRPLTAAPAEEPRTIMAANEPEKAHPAEVAKAHEPQMYAIQVSSAQSLEALKADMRNLGLSEKVEYYHRTVDGNSIYAALYGSYNSFNTARTELQALKGRINQDGLWIHTINESQKVSDEPKPAEHDADASVARLTPAP